MSILLLLNKQGKVEKEEYIFTCLNGANPNKFFHSKEKGKGVLAISPKIV